MKFVKSSLLVKLVILILVVYATVTLVSLRQQINEKNEQEAILNSSIASVARDKLGMVEEGDIIFYDVGE